ncbi:MULTISPECIES: DUF6555 family protein [unclassified Pseudomonas]|uniref:DUF6555 family protein n=1 Tax=unclassified Pseudomonas TaxID=196821 RepID=UPI0034DDC405
MANPIPFAIHYLLDGVGKHFYTLTSRLDDSDAIRLATRHAASGPENYIALGTTREMAELMAEKVGVTKVRWNAAV